MAGNLYENGLWVSQGDPVLVNEEVTATPTDNAAAGATRQFVAGQVGKKINLNVTPGSLLVKEYQYVLRNETAQLVGPTVVCWDDPTDGLFGVVAATTGGVPAGIFLGDDTAGVGQRGVQAGNYGFIQVGGHVELLCGSTVTAGSDVTYVIGTGTIVDRTDFGEPLVAVALESGTSGDSVFCLLDLISVD